MKQIFKFICCGSVDDGKSTLIGRLLLDTGNVKKDQLEDAKKASLKNGSFHFEPAMLLDGLLDERAQQITIDVAHRYFDYKNTRFHILDCPGHIQYTKNMAIAAAQAQAAIVVIDVTKGIREQTKNHIRICDLFHIPFLCICLTKCDLLPGKSPFSKRPQIKRLTQKINTLLSKYPFDYTILSISALTNHQMQDVLQTLYSQAQATNKRILKQKEQILHVLAAKSYRGKRYYYAREASGQPIKPGKYWVYPQKLPLTIAHLVSPGCFQIKEELDIAPGDCITNVQPLISNLLSHQTIWFEPPTKNLLLKHGARLAHVVRYTDNKLELDQPILFHNIEDFKMNGFGVFIDEVSKKTLGCCVFTGNKETTPATSPRGKTYWMENTTEEFRTAAKSVLGISVYLDIDVVKKILSPKKSPVSRAVFMLAQLLNEQGLSVGIKGTKSEKAILIYKEESSCSTVQLKMLGNYVRATSPNGRKFSVLLSKHGERACLEEIKKKLTEPLS